MIELKEGYYTANAFNIENILIDLSDYEKRENLVFYPKIFKYKEIIVGDIVFWINEFGSGLSLQKIDGARTLDDALRIYNNHDYYYPSYYNLVSTINSSFNSKITDTDISFVVGVSEVKRESEYAQIFILGGKSVKYFTAVFVESIFVLQLCRLLERKLVSLVNQKRSFNSQKILTELVSNLFIIEKPQGFMPNHDEFEYMKEMYSVWKIEELIKTLKEKYDLSLTNYRFFLEYDEKRQNILTTLLLGSITVFSINQTIPILYESFPIFDKQLILLIFTFIALYIAGYTFVKYYLLEILDKFFFKRKNRKLKKRLENDN